ncbi:serine hydrolase [Faecalicoccus sp. LCP19S3_E2]|uniref:serine hydrolase n=2 Tax=Faecalicoccus TaxID=1573536 RepID=UPI003F8EB59A
MNDNVQYKLYKENTEVKDIVMWKVSDSSIAEVDSNGNLMIHDAGCIEISAYIDEEELLIAQYKVEILTGSQFQEDDSCKSLDNNSKLENYEEISDFDLNLINNVDYRNQWVLLNSDWYYFDSNGNKMIGWVYLGNIWYYLDTEGKMLTGFQDIAGQRYYFNNAGYMLTGWQLIEGKYYYFDASGAMARDTWIGDYYVDELGIWDTDRFKPQWILNGTGWWYRHEDGSYTTNDFEVINGQTYYFNAAGYMVTGWQLVDDIWYYFDGSGAMKTGWIYVGNIWYYLDTEGKMLTGFQDIAGQRYYFNNAGYMLTGWQLIEGKYYYFDASGAMAKDTWIGDYYVDENGVWDTDRFKPQWILNGTGWWYRHEDGSYTTNDFEVINGQTYYFNAAGYMVTGWQLVDDTWYYFDGSGAMKTGWIYVGNIWYYLDTEGKMLTGFQNIAGQRYYFSKDGSLYMGWIHDENNWHYYTDQGLYKGWLYVNNNWYWLDENGVMLTGNQIIHDVKYYFNESGAMHTGWLEKDSLWYFYDSGGAMKTGWVFTGNLWYWLNDEGIMQTGYQTINGNQYYFNPNGSMYIGWHYKEGSWYYFGDYGIVRGWITVNGNFYYLNQDGVMVTGDVTIDGEKYIFAASGELISSENLRMLESQILNYINANAYSGELWSVSVINLSKPGRIDINNRQQQAASLTKLFVMGAVYENYESLVSRYGQSIIDSNLHYMITISDNSAWVNLVTWLGYGNYASGTSVVTTWAQNHGYTLTATYPYSYQNFSSSQDTAQIVADMYNGKLRYSDRMLNLLYQQTRRHKIPAGIPSGVLVGNKTGELADTENDTAIIYGPNCTYVLSVMCTSSKSAGHSQSMIRTISSMVYNYLNS